MTTTGDAFEVALEGECDPRRQPERGARLDGLLDDMPDEQLEAIYLAAHRLAEAVSCAQIRRDMQRMAVAQ